jgi:hypothetical protein
MKLSGPRVVSPRDGFNWLYQALLLLTERPALFLLAALVAPLGTSVLLSWPWDALLPVAAGWLTVSTTVFCYGFPLTFAISLACGFARLTQQRRRFFPQHLIYPTTLRVLLRSALFSFVMLLQGYLILYLLFDNVKGLANAADTYAANPSFGLAESVLATQLGMIGGFLLVLQVSFACFVIPLYLFREMPLQQCWRLSFLAVQLNPWLLPALGLLGFPLLVIAYSGFFSMIAQVLAFPLAAYFGALLYVAWLQVFQGGIDEVAQVTDKAMA